LLRRFAPRNDGFLISNMSARSRGAMRPSCAGIIRPKNRGRGECRVPAAPAASRAKFVVSTRASSPQVHRGHPAFPHAMVLRLISCSPRRRIRLVTVVSGLRFVEPGRADLTSADLTPATGARTTRLHRPRSAVRLRALDRSQAEARPAITSARPALPRPPHPAPRP
jgi:hypothetical protein